MKQDAYTYSYTGSAQELEHLCNGYYKVELWGAEGGRAYVGEGEPSFVVDGSSATTIQQGGSGGYVAGNINMSKTSQLYIYVGNKPDLYYTDGSFNGGGKTSKEDNTYGGGSGGGATDIRTISGDWNNANSLRSRIIVAGAGGGGAYYSNTTGGKGGGLIGYIGGHDKRSTSSLATGGTQISGGLKSGCSYKDGVADAVWCKERKDGGFGYGGDAVIVQEGAGGFRGGGGGSGWYGGGGGAEGYSFTGAGGSSYISGMSGSIGVTATGAAKCSAGSVSVSCSQSWTGYTFTNTLMIDGAGYSWTNVKGGLEQMPNPSGGYYVSGVGHSGNGAARITYLGPTI